MAIKEVDVWDGETLRRRLKAEQLRLKEIERLKARDAKGAQPLTPQQHEKIANEAEVRATLATVEAELKKPEEANVTTFEIQTAWGTHSLPFRAGESIPDLAKRFCRERNLDSLLARMLADRMEQKLAQLPGRAVAVDAATNGGGPMTQRPHGGRNGPQPRAPDLGDKAAVARRIRILQKKLREIERLKELLCERESDGSRSQDGGTLDPMQREKLATEDDVLKELASLQRELDRLERLPKMVFDVDTDDGVQQIEYREGDDCYELASGFCRQHGLGEELIEPLAQHMEQTLSVQASPRSNGGEPQ